MNRIQAVVLGLVAVGWPSPGWAEEKPATSKIVGVDLFKNGLVVVRREATLGRPGAYVFDDVPEPVHGTFSIESAGPIDAVVRLRDVEVPIGEAVPGALQDDLADKVVTVHLRGERKPPITGRVVKIKPPKGQEAAGPPRHLLLQTGNGRTYVEASEIAAVEANEAGGTVTRKMPRLVLTLGETPAAETKVVIRYLTRGMAWAPSYRLDVTDPKTLKLEQTAVVRNELADLDGVEVRLISGYPSVAFAHVRSPLAARTNLNAFFAELARRDYSESAALGNIRQQSVGLNNFVAVDAPLAAVPTGEGVDLHYQSIGKRSLADGAALGLTVAKGAGPYERVVEWLVPDHRSEDGQYRGRGGDEEDDSAWDALKFKNPLAFPLTTGPAMVVAKEAFSGQRTITWVNAGEETLLRVNKALSVRTRAVESELVGKDGGREAVWVGGRQFRKSTVEGELTVNNHRKEAVQLVIRRRFSGELVRADGVPKSALREEGVHSINRRNELLWSLPLGAGEERKLKYTYTVLVPF